MMRNEVSVEIANPSDQWPNLCGHPLFGNGNSGMEKGLVVLAVGGLLAVCRLTIGCLGRCVSVAIRR